MPLIATFYVSSINCTQGVIPPWWQWWLWSWRSPGQQNLRYIIRAVLACIGMLLVWVGLNNAEESLGFEMSLGRFVLKFYLCVDQNLLFYYQQFKNDQREQVHYSLPFFFCLFVFGI